MNNTIWQTSGHLWPKASSAYVFLAKAFYEVGRALYRDDWTGREALPPECPLTDASRRTANLLAAQRLPPPISSIRTGRAGISVKTPIAELTPEALAAIERARATLPAKLEAEAKEAAGHLGRRAGVAKWIADRARDGDLETYGVFVGGHSAPYFIERHYWNVQNDWTLFEACEVTVRHAPQWAPVRYHLFLTRASLEKCLADETRRPSARTLSSDSELIELMYSEKVKDPGASITQLSYEFADRAEGSGTSMSKAKRLERKYIAKHVKG